MYNNITAAILSGGKSSRMGYDKSLAILNGIPIIEHVINSLKNIFNNIVISGEKPYSNYPLIKDIYKNRDSIGGIYSVLKSIDTEYAFITACDMPFIEENAIKLLLNNIDNNHLIIPKIKGKFQPLFAIYSKSCILPIEELMSTNKLKISHLINKVKTKIINEEDFKKICNVNKNFFNINSEKDFEKAINNDFNEAQFIGIVAKHSKSGKTTLIKNLIPFFKQDGYNISIIKNVFHKLEIDKKGKDSYIFFESGADSVVINSNNEIVVRKRKIENIPLKYIRDYFIQESDVILVEGHKKGNFPKLEVIKEGQDSFLFKTDDNIIAIIGNQKINSTLPFFKLDEYNKIYQFIKNKFLK